MSTPTTEERLPAEAWLATFPATHHGTLEGWFRHAIRQGAQNPDQVIITVTVLIGHKLDWSVEPSSRQLCTTTLEALRCNRAGALAYATSLLMERTS
jgi:hypothetical protein